MIFNPTDGRTEFCRKYIKPGAEITLLVEKPNTYIVRFKGQRHTDIISKDFVKN